MTITIIERAEADLRSLLFYDPAHDEGHPAVRYVGRVPGMDNGGNEDEYADDRIRLASSRSMSTVSDAHVALSFCDDGYHRPLLDIDQRNATPLQVEALLTHLEWDCPIETWTATRSTHGGVHLWSAHAMAWEQYEAFLKDAQREPLVDHDWCRHAIRRGFAALRLPGVTKGWGD